MPELDTKVIEFPAQVDESGSYEITEVKGPQATRMGRQALILLVKDAKGKILSLFVPFGDTASTRTNLGRLIGAFGKNTDKWMHKRVTVTIGEDGKRKVEAA